MRAETLYLTAARMIDPAAGRAIEKPALVIKADRIAAIGVFGDRQAPAGARRIDLPDQTILPGLIDMHTHITSRHDTHGWRALAVTAPAEAVSGVANAWTSLQAGFTALRNVGANGYADVALRDSINAGETIGPRLFVSGPLIGATGGHCDNNLLPACFGHSAEGIADGPDAIRAKVREVHKYGANLIKLCATGGVLSKGTTIAAQQLASDELAAAAEAAHMLGLRVAAHAHGTEGVRAAIEAGIDTIEHASLADDDCFEKAIARGTVFDMDIYNDDFILAEGAKMGMLPESLAKERSIGRAQRETFRRAHRAGVKMTFGTDAGVYPHGDNARQFAKMVEWGMTPMQAIRAATIDAAAALGDLGAGLGALRRGAYADIIAVSGDPLADVRTLEAPSFVMKGGVVWRLGAAPMAR